MHFYENAEVKCEIRNFFSQVFILQGKVSRLANLELQTNLSYLIFWQSNIASKYMFFLCSTECPKYSGKNDTIN